MATQSLPFCFAFNSWSLRSKSIKLAIERFYICFSSDFDERSDDHKG